MDIERRLRKLESQYRAVSSAAVAARAHYLALASEANAPPLVLQRAESAWQQINARKAELVAQMDELESLEGEPS